MRLTGIHGFSFYCGSDRSNDRSTASPKPMLGWVGGIVVCSNEPSPVSDGSNRHPKAVIAQVPVEANDDSIELRWPSVSRGHGDAGAAPRHHRFMYSAAAQDKDSLSVGNQTGRGHCGRQNTSRSVDTEAAQLGFLLGHGRRAVVRCEQHPMSGVDETGHRFTGGGNGLGPVPENSVEVEDYVDSAIVTKDRVRPIYQRQRCLYSCRRDRLY